jgi:ATP-dependent helicase/nuclease subunit B
MVRKEIWTEPVLGLNRQRFIDRCRDAIVAGQEDSFIYLVSTGALWKDITGRILDGQRVRACRELRVFIFDGLVNHILKHAGEDRRFISDGTKYCLLEQLIGKLTTADVLRHIPAIALQPGTIESVSRVVGEIKRAGMPPELFREFVSVATPQARDLDMAAIYEAYQQLLDERGLMDADEAAARALTVLRTRSDLPPWMSKTTTLFIDGFYDFTPIQKQLLRYLIERMPEVIINLTYDPRNSDVFQEPLKETLLFLDRLSQPIPTRHFEQTRPCAPALLPLRTGLFNPGVSPAPDRPPITILAAASLSHEVQEVAKEIKRLIVEQDHRPNEVAVVAREPSGYLEAAHQALSRIGVPSALHIQKPLTSIPSVRAALKVLDCRVAQEETEPYLALLKNDYLEHFSSLDRDAVENAVLAVGVQIPIRQWRQRVRDVRRIKAYQADRAANRPADRGEAPSEPARLQRGIAQLDGALAAMDGMRKALGQIPEQGTLPEMAQGWLAALRAFRLGERLHERLKTATEPDLRLLARDLRALKALRQTLEEVQRITEAGQTPRVDHQDADIEDQPSVATDNRQPTTDNRRSTSDQLTVDQFRTLITHILQRSSFRIERGDPGGVQLLEATRARGRAFRAVFIAGLIEGQFPASPERDWIYPHLEREKLADVGLFLRDLSPKRFEAKEEYFFYMAACQATERLYLSYPRANANGEANVISSFIEEVHQLYHDGRASLVPVQQLSPSTYDVRRIASAPEAAQAVLASLYQSTPDDALVLHLYNHAVDSGLLPPMIFTRLQIEAERQGSTFGLFDGRLMDQVIQQQLRQWFGPDRIYSSSQLNHYGQCPFLFFCQHVLRLERREEASLDLLAAERGRLMHTILHDFLQHHLGANLIPSRRQEYQEELRRIAEATFNRYKQTVLPMSSSLWELQTEEVLHTLMRFLDAEIKYQDQVSRQGVRPQWLDLSFGRTDQEHDHPELQNEPFVLTRTDDMIKLRGWIDRVDRSTDGKYIIYDYQSPSGTGVKEMRDGLDLRVPLLISAFAELFLKPGEEVIGGGDYSLKGFDRNSGLYREEFQSYTAISSRAASSMSSGDWHGMLEGAAAYAWQYVDGMRGGDFRVQPKDDSYCSRCTYQTVCRYEKQRIQIKLNPAEN